jgi:hypothetical protein
VKEIASSAIFNRLRQQARPPRQLRVAADARPQRSRAATRLRALRAVQG